MKSPLISVIIPAFNEEKRIANCLTAFQSPFKQKIPFEVIVVDDGSTDKTSFIASQFEFAVVIKGKHRGASAARNLGAKKARANILAFTDADCIPDHNWISTIINEFEKTSTHCLEGKTTTDKTGLFEHAVENEKGKGYQSCNLAILKKSFFEVDGFDEQYVYFREDSDLAFKLIQAKIPIHFVSRMIVFHPKRPIAEKAFFRELYLIKNDVLLFKKFPKLYFEHFGFLCKGNIKQSIVVWILTALAIIGFYYSAAAIAVFIILLVAFRYLVSMRKKTFSAAEGVRFIAITTIRDWLFPFFFVYYLAAIWPQNKKAFH